jgi:hypothetical protein
MSLDLYVHCKSSRRLKTKELFDALTARQMGAALFEDYIDYKPVRAGPLEFCTILGWMPKSFDRARLDGILRGADKENQLEQLFADEVLASANVEAHDAADHYENFDDDYPDSLAGDIDQRFIDFMKSAKTVYEINTSAGSSDLSWRFQMALCCAIAELVDGLIEEPQMAEFFFPKEAEKHFRGFSE